MTVQLLKEPFVGKYDGVSPATLLGIGDISDGLNMRKVGEQGGWKVRKGATLHNTTTIGVETIFSLHRYKHPRNADYHFLAQYNGNLYDATNDPPAAGSTFGTSLVSGLSTTLSGFSDMVGEAFFYADGNDIHTWGGDNPFCSGFIVWDNSEDSENDYTRDVRDERSDTAAVILSAASDCYYVISPEIAEAITLDLGTMNAVAAITSTVKAWRSGAWVAVSDFVDGTISGAKTHAQDGAFTWTRSALDEMRVFGGIQGYVYQVTFSASMTSGVTVKSCKVKYDMTEMTNKWSGVYEFPMAVRLWDGTESAEVTGKVTNESTSQYMQMEALSTSSYIYVKSVVPLCGIGFGVVPDYEQTDNAQVDEVAVWTGAAYETLTILKDGTLRTDASFRETGVLWFDPGSKSPKRRTMVNDSAPGYWYRVSWDVLLGNTGEDVRIFAVTVAYAPEDLAPCDGVVEFKGRLFVWGDPEYPNRMRYSAKGRPDCLAGADSGYTDEFGNMEKIVCAKRFYNELIVWKENSVWLLEGYSPQNFGTLRIADTIGLASPKTAMVVETGYPAMKTDEPLSIAIWQDTDGVYALDGRKPKKVSGSIEHYFNTEYTTAILAAQLQNRQAFVDPLNNEYHLLLPSSELVYNYIRDEWYPPWERDIDLVCGLCLRGTTNRYHTYGGSADGQVFRLENGTVDKNASNVDVLISHNIKTRAISLKPDRGTTMRFTFRKLWLEAKARTNAVTVTVTFYGDMKTSGDSLTVPAAMTLTNSGYSLALPGVYTSKEGIACFQLKFSVAEKEKELEVWSMLYEIEARGEIVI